MSVYLIFCATHTKLFYVNWCKSKKPSEIIVIITWNSELAFVLFHLNQLILLSSLFFLNDGIAE